jgi:ABC-type multidrug transport system fused ATPase/permease subunit
MKKILGFLFLKENKSDIYRLWKISIKHKYILVFALIMLILNTIQNLFIPIKINDFTTIFTSKNVSKSFLDSALYFFFLFISLNFFDIINEAASDAFTLTFFKSMMEYYVNSLFDKDLEFFDKNKISDLFSLLTEDIKNLSDISILGLFGFFKTLVKGVGSLFLMFYFYFKLTCLLILIMPFILYIINKRFKQAKKDQQNLIEQKQGVHNIVFESLENIKTVKAFSTEDKEKEKYEKQLQKMYKNLLNYLIKMTISKNIVSIIIFCLIMLIIRLGIYFAKKETEKNPDFSKNLLAFMLYCIMFMSTFSEFSNKYEKIQKSLVIAEKVFKIIDYEPNIKNLPENKYSYMKIEGNIEFKNINFSYPTKKDVEILKKFNLKIDKRTCIGIVGASGSGKSTIVNLIQRLYNCGSNVLINRNDIFATTNKLDSEYIELPNMDSNSTNLDDLLIDSDISLIKTNKEEDKKLIKEYDEGENSFILIDNVNLKYLNLKHFHNQLGYVCQEPPLFNSTILENILYGLDNPESYDKSFLEKVIKISKSDFIFDKNLFPKGLDTLVGEKGSQLSGGQKQRIAIARALMKKPKILIMDESTSALDSESEFQIWNSIYDLGKEINMGIIIIAHRLSSVKNCDKIIVVDNGIIAESGTHQELMNLNGKYKELMEKQLNVQKDV